LPTEAESLYRFRDLTIVIELEDEVLITQGDTAGGWVVKPTEEENPFTLLASIALGLLQISSRSDRAREPALDYNQCTGADKLSQNGARNINDSQSAIYSIESPS